MFWTKKKTETKSYSDQAKDAYSRLNPVVTDKISARVSPNETVANIHRDFDEATQRLLNNANDILNKEIDIEKGKSLSAVGFKSVPSAIDASTIHEIKNKSKSVLESVLYFQQHYPNNKFITEDVVQDICKKYGLLFSDSSKFISEIPDKNAKEICDFKLRDEDKIILTGMTEKRKSDHHEYEVNLWVNNDFDIKIYSYSFDYDRHQYVTEKDFSVGATKYHVYPFKVVASLKDFDTTNMRITAGYKLENIPDPVVLQPVKGGYLIVSKWGLEANDPLLTNEKHN